ncbi:hypothetical protein Leryth_010770 [Lithospermum erythrorhizon]|nr:hypothetical protein Leryth_010770 [Lithospermum erythrorhizon]
MEGFNQREAGKRNGKPIKTCREDTPLLGNNSTPLSCQSKTFANLFIAIVGAGVLGLPYTFKKAGWFTSTVTIFSIAGLVYHGMMLLVHTRRRLQERLPPPGSTNERTDHVFSFGDLGFAACGNIGRASVDTVIVISQSAFCIGYLIFIGNTLAHLFYSTASLSVVATDLLVSRKIFGIRPKTVYIWACFPFQLGLNSIPTLTHLAPLSIFADIVQFGSMGMVLVQDAVIINHEAHSVKAFGSVSTFFYGMGVAIYTFEGIGMVLPLEDEMKDKPKFPKLLCVSMFSIAFVYAAFGLLSYLAFGENTQDIITSNMGKGLLSTLVQLGLCINLFFTFPLMMNPVYEVFESRFFNGGYCMWMRWLVVLVISLVALYVPYFTDFLSLVGSSACCVLGLVFPALFHYIVFKDEMSQRGAIMDLAVIAVGIIFGISGTWYSLKEIFAV